MKKYLKNIEDIEVLRNTQGIRLSTIKSKLMD